MVRTTIFWIHLACGVCAGLVVLQMSVTGVILAYERQIVALADRAYHAVDVAGGTRESHDRLIAAAIDADFVPTHLTLSSDPTAPVVVRAGRASQKRLNPYTGEIITSRDQALDTFFSTVTRWHRWFNATDDNRAVARAITGACNLMFLFLVASGMYLWLPKIYEWAAFRAHLWFTGTTTTAARDFNWHHVFGIWAALPLIIVVASATVFNYSWANELVYRVVGEEAPQRGGRQGSTDRPRDFEALDPVNIDMLVRRGIAEVELKFDTPWQTLTVALPRPSAETTDFQIDLGNGGQPQKRHAFTLDTTTGALVAWTPFESLSPGRQLRSWIRFLHTGEALGIAGQTIAGLASAAAVIMVWTGLSLALRRLQRFLARQRRINEKAGRAINETF